MAVDTPYTDESRIVSLLGQMGIDLRLDDSVDAASDLSDAIDVGTMDLDYYLADRYAAADIAGSEWCMQQATFFAVRWLCVRRGNGPPAEFEKEMKRREDQCELIRERKANVPRLAHSRRPGVVTNHKVDLRRWNNQVRTDTTRSTGQAQGYNRPTDNTAPDDR